MNTSPKQSNIWLDNITIITCLDQYNFQKNYYHEKYYVSSFQWLKNYGQWYKIDIVYYQSKKYTLVTGNIKQKYSN